MKKGLLLIAAALACLIAVSCQPAKPSLELKIGFIAPLTGDYADYGRKLSQAAALAVEEYNTRQEIKFVVSLVQEDSQGNADKAAAAIDKLIVTDKISGLIGDVFSSSSLALLPKIDAAKIVQISPASASLELIGKTPYFFRTVADDASQADILARYTATVTKAQKVAILHTKNADSQNLAQAFSKAFQAQGGTVVATESGIPGDADFKTQLAKIKAANPEVIFVPNNPSEIAQILEQAAGLGLTAKFLASEAFSTTDVLTLAGKYAEGVEFTASPDTTSDKAATFLSAYKNKFKEDADDFSKNSYDAANILINAFLQVYERSSDEEKKLGNLSRESLRSAVAATRSYEGASGSITFATNGNLVKNWAIKTAVREGAELKFKQTGVYKVDNDTLIQIQ